MIAWEYPEVDDVQVNLGLPILIMDFLGYWQHRFYEMISLLNKHPERQALQRIKMTIGISSGSALKIFGLGEKNFNYYGMPVEQADALQRSAQNEGIMANLDFASDHLWERYCLEPTDRIITNFRLTELECEYSCLEVYRAKHCLAKIQTIQQDCL